MITIVDYGLGNTGAFLNMYRRMGIQARCASDAGALESASRIVLPGVGAFDHAMELLDASGMRPVLDALVKQQDVPVLGVCVGMQMLAESSEEGTVPGLGWVPGCVRRLSTNPSAATMPMPHMGWNDVAPVADHPLFAGLDDWRFYFLHSFYFDAASGNDISARAQYGFDFPCAVGRGNVFGVQFHPEKSHHWGAALLRNFAEA